MSSSTQTEFGSFGNVHVTNLGPTDQFPTFVMTETPLVYVGDLITRRIATVTSVPAIVETETYAPSEKFVERGGVNFFEAIFPPGSSSAMHETSSIDFGILTKGELVLILDGGEERLVKAGDIFVQRATNHQWENRTSESAHFAAVLVASNMPQGKTSAL